uniref:Uncharacterized protein n=1 Tax=Anguilla anguilla TaxID=7936 RepID=A0A0E9UFK3_ANGAN
MRFSHIRIRFFIYIFDNITEVKFMFFCGVRSLFKTENECTSI